MDDMLKQAALDFHQYPQPGKIQVAPTKALATQHDLSLAYSPGVAAPCLEIQANPQDSYKYTARGNLVAVVSNGTAVLGLGNIGAEASKPVMEGKGVLFKKFAGIDVFDIEINETDPEKLVDIIASLEPYTIAQISQKLGFDEAEFCRTLRENGVKFNGADQTLRQISFLNDEKIFFVLVLIIEAKFGKRFCGELKYKRGGKLKDKKMVA